MYLVVIITLKVQHFTIASELLNEKFNFKTLTTFIDSICLLFDPIIGCNRHIKTNTNMVCDIKWAHHVGFDNHVYTLILSTLNTCISIITSNTTYIMEL